MSQQQLVPPTIQDDNAVIPSKTMVHKWYANDRLKKKLQILNTSYISQGRSGQVVVIISLLQDRDVIYI